MPRIGSLVNSNSSALRLPAAPAGAASYGETTPANNLPTIKAIHDIPYVATATLSHLDDHAEKLAKA